MVELSTRKRLWLAVAICVALGGVLLPAIGVALYVATHKNQAPRIDL